MVKYKKGTILVPKRKGIQSNYYKFDNDFQIKTSMDVFSNDIHHYSLVIKGEANGISHNSNYILVKGDKEMFNLKQFKPLNIITGSYPIF